MDCGFYTILVRDCVPSCQHNISYKRLGITVVETNNAKSYTFVTEKELYINHRQAKGGSFDPVSNEADVV